MTLYDDRPDRRLGLLGVANVGNFLQFVALLVTIIALAMHGEGRIAAIEQHLNDMEQSRRELIAHIDRIENRLDAIASDLREGGASRR